MDKHTLTPIKKIGEHFYKMENEFIIHNVCGGKVRVVNELVKKAINQGYKNFVTCGSRDSRQCQVVANICAYYNVNSHLFMPNGKETDIMKSILGIQSSTIHQTKVGYNNVLIYCSKEFSKNNNMYYIPFGLDCLDTIDINMHQVQNIPDNINRIIIPCGSGMNMISVIKGLEYYKRTNIEVVGVIVGSKPYKIFEKYLPNNLFEKSSVKWSFLESPQKYNCVAKETTIDGIELDNMYEAKCIPFLKKGDLLWIVGKKII